MHMYINSHFFPSHLFIYYCQCVWCVWRRGVCTYCRLCVEGRRQLCGVSSLVSVWVPGIGPRLPACLASTFICWAISLALFCTFGIWTFPKNWDYIKNNYSVLFLSNLGITTYAPSQVWPPVLNKPIKRQTKSGKQEKEIYLLWPCCWEVRLRDSGTPQVCLRLPWGSWSESKV